MEYISSRIKLIENSAKLKLGTIKEDFNIDDGQILREILLEYEKYKEDENSKQSAHQKFVDGYKVSPKDLQPIVKVSEGKQKEKEEKGYEDLPGDVIE